MITQEQYAQSMSLLQQNTATANMVQTRASISTNGKLCGFYGKFLYPSACTVESKGLKIVPWVIDTGALDHMV